MLFAVRENERAAMAYGVNAVSAKLTAFAFSGFIAAAAGALYVHHQQGLAAESYNVGRSLQVFVEVVVGGLGSPAGAILGGVVIEGISYFKSVFPETIRTFLGLFTSSIGLIFVLMVLPGGLAQGIYGIRDRLLRLVAERRGIMVPSLFADGRVEAPAAEAVDETALLLGDDLDVVPDEPPPPRRRRREPLRAGSAS